MAKSDEDLAKDFLKATRIDQIPEISQMIAIGLIVYALQESRVGNKSLMTQHIEGFGADLNTAGVSVERTEKAKRALTKYVAKHGNPKLSYKQGFVKRLKYIKNIMTAAKKKGPEEARRLSQELHRSMTADKDIPDVKYGAFEKELLTAFKGKLPTSFDADDTPRPGDVKKFIARINWSKIIRKYKLPNGTDIQLKDIAEDALKAGERGNKKLLDRAADLISYGKAPKAKPADLYRDIHDAVEEATGIKV